MELALENAKMVLDKDRERMKREEGRTIGAVREVEQWLGIKDIVRMEPLIFQISAVLSQWDLWWYMKKAVRKKVIIVSFGSNLFRDLTTMQVWKRY